MGQEKHRVKTVCRFCRREFDSFAMKKVCPECDSSMEDEFRRMKEYIHENPDATMAQICEALKVTTALVKYYLREERLVIRSEKANYFLKCVICGNPITSGRYCFECEVVATRSDMKQMTTQNKEEIEMDQTIAKYHINRRIRKNR